MTDATTPGWTGGQRAFGDFAPALVHYTDRVLFDEVWERPELSKRDRSLVTVAALLAGGNTEQQNFHLAFAKQNGVTCLVTGSAREQQFSRCSPPRSRSAPARQVRPQ